MNLQTIALDNLLSQIPINEHTEKSLNKFFTNYKHEKVIQQIMDDGLYHVYYRLQDPYTIDSFSEMILLKTFINKQDAAMWIINHGKDIIYKTTKYGKPMVLTLIYADNHGLYPMGVEPTNLNRITCKKYLTYAFDEYAYNMLINEHFYMLKTSEYDEVIPYWIHYVTPEKIHYGINISHLYKIHEQICHLDKETKEKNFNDLERLHKNPEKYLKLIK